ncbi:hypothetical protein AMTR_s00002p00122570 [Amborella trichopoda]|uniref:Uncharacterized protein n=1 Tax=Amborella trichopoda TaxID=13333 RepID=W1P039_AMBTC|nr:hypothetical protein AMTR_s00002p00122570 [Amborella trichopoda]
MFLKDVNERHRVAELSRTWESAPPCRFQQARVSGTKRPIRYGNRRVEPARGHLVEPDMGMGTPVPVPASPCRE